MTTTEFLDYLLGHPSTTRLGRQLAVAYVRSAGLEGPLAARPT